VCSWRQTLQGSEKRVTQKESNLTIESVAVLWRLRGHRDIIIIIIIIIIKENDTYKRQLKNLRVWRRRSVIVKLFNTLYWSSGINFRHFHLVCLQTQASGPAEQETQLSLTNCATQMQWRGWPPKTRSSPVLPCRIWSLCVKGCRHKKSESQKLGSAGTPLPSDGRRDWPEDTRPSPTGVITSNSVVLRQTVYA